MKEIEIKTKFKVRLEIFIMKIKLFGIVSIRLWDFKELFFPKRWLKYKMKECEHKWKEDEMFACGGVTMFFGDIGNINEETRVICELCGAIDFKKKHEVGG